MRRLLLFVLLLCSVVCHAQFFVGNSDYVYAVGKAKTQIEAENAALLSLANTIGIKVTNVSSYTVTENGGKVSENYRKNISTNSSMSFGDEVQTYVEADKKTVTVYKYINKKEYVVKQTKIYNDCLTTIDSLFNERRQIKHSKNLILGQYYTAYNALDNPIMDCYSPKNIEIKNKLWNTIRETYMMDGPYGYPSLTSRHPSYGYCAVIGGECSHSMYGIEYLRDGKWELPGYCYYSILKDNGTSDCFSADKTPRVLLYSQTNKIYIRYLYEYEENGMLYKIDVPEKWYFDKILIENLRLVD